MVEQTPQWFDGLIDSLAPSHFAEEIKGDLFELFLLDIEKKGIRYAKRRYIFNGLGFLGKSFFWKSKNTTQPSPTIMLGNYFKMAKRSLLSYKTNTAINISGLVIGIASALVILTVVRFELSFDKFHSDSERIYRVVRTNAEYSGFRSGISYPVASTLKDGIAGIEEITSMFYLGSVLVEVPDGSGSTVRRFQEDKGCVMVGSSFFKVFDFNKTNFKWISGNPEHAFDLPFHIVLTRSQAKKLFGNQDPVGKTLRFNRDRDCKVSGVIEDLPSNTDLPFTMLVSYASVPIIMGDGMNDWYSVNDDHHVYVKLREGTNKETIDEEIKKVHEARTPKDLNQDRIYFLQALNDVHHDPRFGNYNGRTITLETILALAIIGIFLLLTGSFNYINLATAQSTLRSKEIGLRKVLGSNRKNLIGQFLTETFVVVTVSAVVALLVSELFLQNLQSLINIQFTRLNFTDPVILLSVLGIILVVTFFAGFYPSMIISGFNPITALKNNLATDAVGGFNLRKVLVVAQFAIAQILVISTFIVVSQMKFFRTVDMGFNRDAIITLPVPERTVSKKNVLKDRLLEKPFISGVSFSSTLPSGLFRSRSASGIQRWESTAVNEQIIFDYHVADPSYIEVYEIKLLEGRNIALSDSIRNAIDSSRNILINETLARNLGFQTNEDAINQQLRMSGMKTRVVGVIGDFYGNSVKEGVENIVLTYQTRPTSVVSIKLANLESLNLSETLPEIQNIWTLLYPEYIFEYRFFDENIEAFYEQEKKYAQLFQIFSIVFILIGCLGLYGLISFVVNRKGKEVAIRKVLGATVQNILVLFSKEYVQLIAISFVIAVPVAYYAVDSWLSNFENQIDLSWWLFVIPGLSVLLLAVVVVIAKSLNTAVANPVDKLKYE